MNGSKFPKNKNSELTSTGVPWSEISAEDLPAVEWIEGRQGGAHDGLPSLDAVPVPSVLFTLPVLHERRPRGSKAMLDVAGARHRLASCRPGAWVVSAFTGSRWAKWPSGEVGWLPPSVVLPEELRVSSR